MRMDVDKMRTESIGQPASEEEGDDVGLHIGRGDIKRKHAASISLNPAEFDPSMLTEIDDDNDCCEADGGLERCCSHCWFLMTCLTCYVYSSLLRLVVIVDFVGTLVMFIEHLTSEGNRVVQDEITKYDFSRSVIFVMVLSTVRNCLLFICFSYQYQTYHSTFITATSLTAFSVVYLSVKLVFCVDGTGALPITLYSLSMSIMVYFLYGCIRRRRISVPPRKLASLRHDYEKLHDNSLDEGDVEAATISSPPQPAKRERFVSVPDGVSARSLADADSQFVDFDGITVHYRFTQSKTHPKKHALVLLHGFGGNVFSWKKVWAQLATRTQMPVLAFDFPGFGLTSRPTPDTWEHNPYTQQYSLMLIFKMMDYLGIKRATFVGHGSGGGLAVLAAAMRPKRVNALVLVSPAIFSSGFPVFLRSLFRTRLGKSIVTDLVRSEMGELILRRSYHKKEKLTEDVLQTYKNLLKVDNWDAALLELAQVEPTVKVESKLALVECPIGIIHGVNDKLIPFSESKRLQATLERHGQRGELRGIEACGHVPHEEVPRIFVDNFIECQSALRSGLDTKLEDVL